MPQQPDSRKNPNPSRLSALGRALKNDAPALLAGLVLALGVGWAVFPQILYSRENQPINFNHVVHLGEAGLDCAACHHLRAVGSFAGLPRLEDCAQCHSAPIGKSPEELRFIKEYVTPGKEVPWLSYAEQPAHVFFSHAAHDLAGCNSCHKFEKSEICAVCHADMSKSDALPPRLTNRITGYSKDLMLMAACERCHALPGHKGTTASNNCATCHK